MILPALANMRANHATQSIHPSGGGFWALFASRTAEGGSRGPVCRTSGSPTPDISDRVLNTDPRTATRDVRGYGLKMALVSIEEAHALVGQA